MKFISKKITIATVLSLGIAIVGCKKDNADDMFGGGGGTTCETADVTFSNTVKSIIDTKCATSGCHATNAPTGINLSAYSGIASIANNGKLMASITHSGSASAMPKGLPKLDDCSIAKIKKWVDDGAPNN